MQYSVLKKFIRIGLISLVCATAVLAYGYGLQIASRTTPIAAATVNPVTPGGSGGNPVGSEMTGGSTNPIFGSAATDPCSCFAGADLLTNAKFSDYMSANVVPQLVGINAHTKSVQDYFNTTIPKQEGRAMKYLNTFFEMTMMQLQEKKGQCDSYLAQYGATTKGLDRTCRNLVENWKYAEEDVPKNIRKDVAMELERTTSYLSPDQTQAVIDQIGLLKDKPFDTNFLDQMVADQFSVQSPNGQIAFLHPNTTLAGAFLHGTYFNTQRLVRLAQNQTDQRVAQSTQELRDQAIAGQGALSISEPVYDITDARTGQIIGHRYSANTTELMTNEIIRQAISAGVQKAINSTFAPATAEAFFPSFNAATGKFEGGVAALRGLGNSGNGGVGFFESGPALGTIPLPAICFVNFADATKTLGVDQTDTETATVTLVGQTKMQDITFTADDNSIVDVSPFSITPPVGQEQATPQYHQITLKGLKPGTTNINATVSITNTSTTCQTDAPLVVTVQSACTINTNPQLFVPSDLTKLVWNNVDTPQENFTFTIPAGITVTKNTDAGLSFGSVSVNPVNVFLATSSPSFVPKSLFTFFDTFAQASSTITLLGPGTTTIDIIAQSASSAAPLCAGSIPAGVGSRCQTQSCQGATPLSRIPHECLQNQEITEFCDGITGYQATDGNNAWCVDAVPPKYQNICATQ